GVLAVVAAARSRSEDTPTPTPASQATTTTAAQATTTTAEAVAAEPIVVGGSLALTGFLAPTAIIHKVAGDLFVETLNDSGGLLGREVVWEPLDDESVPDQAAAIYERVISEDGVDLIMGPYGTGTITAAMAVAEREGFVFPHHTASLTYAYTYACHFPTWPTGVETNITNPNLVFDTLEASGNPPETIAFVMNEFPGTQYIGYGPPNSDAGGAISEAEKRGWEVVAEINFPTGTSDWAPIAAQVAAADPDFIYVGALGVDGPNLLTALDAIGYTPRGHFYQWPAPGPLLGAPNSEGAFSVTTFEPHSPFTDDPEAAAISDAFSAAAAEAGIPYTAFEAQASVSWAAWQVLIAGVEGAGSLDQQEICDWLLDNEIDTIIGSIDFDPAQQNYYGDLTKIKQIQGGEWITVYPEEFAKPGSSPQL
ncbi:MAG: ABC transporter substrate-binding protein, partial [Acidobacteria bacterium]|nr:ABC transporter substrate-binding protein [Acidobacteriota bacterium]